MNRFFIIGVLFLIPITLFAEANISDEEKLKSFLLTAPGTLSGKINKDEPDEENRSSRPAERLQQPLKYKPSRYNRGGESYKFPQYGQVNGRHNPWSEQEQNRSLPPPLPPASPYYSNPWDLGGKLPPQTGSYSPGPYMYNPDAYQAYGPYSNPQNLNPNFPADYYRDTNPAANMPFFNGVMPGMGGDNYGLPFTPFGMF